jgi:hypothetical protein
LSDKLGAQAGLARPFFVVVLEGGPSPLEAKQSKSHDPVSSSFTEKEWNPVSALTYPSFALLEGFREQGPSGFCELFQS